MLTVRIWEINRGQSSNKWLSAHANENFFGVQFIGFLFVFFVSSASMAYFILILKKSPSLIWIRPLFFSHLFPVERACLVGRKVYNRNENEIESVRNSKETNNNRTIGIPSLEVLKLLTKFEDDPTMANIFINIDLTFKILFSINQKSWPHFRPTYLQIKVVGWQNIVHWTMSKPVNIQR